MSGSGDLTNLFQPPGGSDPFRQGRIVTFNPSTGANTVEVAGAVLTNLPILVGGDTVNFAAGDAVILLKYQSSWAILGRIVSAGNQNLTAAAVSFFASSVSTTGPFTLTTSFATHGTRTITTPSWANSLLIMAITTVNVLNTSGATDMLRVITDINGHGGGETITDVENNMFANAVAPVARELRTSYGGAFELGPETVVNSRIRTNAATWTDGGNTAFLNISATFRKVT